MPHDYQKKAIKWMIERSHAGLFLEPGLGKTAISLAGFKILKIKGYARKMLVVAPKRVMYSVWPQEIEKWAEFKHLTHTILHGKEKEANLRKDVDIYLINYDGLTWLVDNGYLDVLVRNGVNVVIFDELSKMKHSNTKRFKSIRKHLHKFARRYGLTGSPAPNGLLDLFGEVYILDRGKRLSEYITHYKNRYFFQKGMYDWLPREGADVEIKNAIKDLVMHMSAEDYLELPPQVDNVINIELTDEARKLYDEMEEELVSLLGGKTLTAPTVAAAMNKCKQIANGAVYLPQIDPVTGERKEKREWMEVHGGKIEALLDLVDEQQGQPLLVAYEYQHDLARLLAALPRGTPFIGGGTSEKDASRLERAWNSNELPILLGHPASIGHGLNLQTGGAHTVCWFSPTWDFELYDQFNRRLRRQGNEADRIVVHHLVARGTVDTYVMSTLRSKNRTQKALLDALKMAWRSRN